MTIMIARSPEKEMPIRKTSRGTLEATVRNIIRSSPSWFAGKCNMVLVSGSKENDDKLSKKDIFSKLENLAALL